MNSQVQAEARPGVQADDDTLLDRFARTRDDAAFAELVARHGGLVLAACRRVLGPGEDAHDAFQATFLVLAHKAGGLRNQRSVGSWLYGVAYRVAVRHRRSLARRRAHEARYGEQVRQASGSSGLDADFQAMLDEELHRLPARFREPLVLCYLQGLTNEEAARTLGCPPGTLFSRLARGRDRLRLGLVRRGIILPAGMLAALLSAQPASSAVPADLATTTLQVAAGTPGAASTSALHLAKGVLNLMFLTKLMKAVSAGVAALALLVGLGFGGRQLYLHAQEEAERSEAAEADLKQIQGTWNVVAMEEGGKELPASHHKDINYRYIFEGNTLRTRMTAPNGKEVGEDLSFRLDPRVTPKAIDVSQNMRTRPGIYELKGNTLRLSYDRGGSRPTSFKTQVGSRQRTLHLERAK